MKRGAVISCQAIILDFRQSSEHDVVLCMKPNGEFVTWVMLTGTKETFFGRYFLDLQDAVDSFNLR